MSTMQKGGLNPGDMGSEVFGLEAGGYSFPVTAIPSVRAAEYAALAAEYRKMPFAAIDPANFMGVHYAWLTAKGPVDVAITCPDKIERFNVHPSRRKVQAAVDGKSLKLTIEETEPRYFVVTMDDHPPLVLVIDPPETDVPDRESSKTLDLATMLIDDSPPAEQSKAFEEAFAKGAKDGKTVFVGPGVYHVGPVRIHRLEKVNVYFAPGSVLRTEVSPPGANIHSHGLWFEDSKDIRIWGRGCLDHQGFGNFAHGRNNYKHGLVSYFVSNDLCPWLSESPVFMMRCQNVSIEGLMVRNGRNMNFNIRRSDDVTLRHCKIITPPSSSPEYTDGYHFNSCVNVLVENCLAYCNDDCFASGHYTHWDNRDSGTHRIRGLVGWNPRANGVRLGFHTYYNQGDFLFENCDFAGITDSGARIHPLHDAPEAFRYQRYGTVRFENCGFDVSRAGGLVNVEGARMGALELKNVEFSGLKQLSIHGLEKGDGIKSVKLQGATGGGQLLKASDADIQNADRVEW